METYLNDLSSILSEEVVLHEKLRHLLQKESESLGNISGAKLLQLHSEKMQITRKVTALEEQRIQLVQKMAEDQNCSPQQLTLRTIIEQASPKFSEALQQHFDQLQTLIGEIRALAESNQQVSQSRLKPIEASLRFLKDAQKQQQTYSMSGKIQESSNPFSRKAI